MPTAPATPEAPSVADLLDRLRELLESDPRSLRAIALAAGLAVNHLYQIRDGDRRPTLESLAKILGALGLKWEALLGE